MAILNKETFMNKIKEKLGDDKSNEAISFLEDITDTYNDLEKKAKGDGEDWKKKYEDNDAEWRKKYTERFFTKEEIEDKKEKEEIEEEKEKEIEKQESIQIKDLFTEN